MTKIIETAVQQKPTKVGDKLYIHPLPPQHHLQPSGKSVVLQDNDVVEPDTPVVVPPVEDYHARISAMQQAVQEPILNPMDEFEGYLDDKPKRGRTEVWSDYDNAVAKAFIYLCRIELGIGREAVDKLLKFLHDPLFDSDKLPPSYYLFSRLENATIPKTVHLVL